MAANRMSCKTDAHDGCTFYYCIYHTTGYTTYWNRLPGTAAVPLKKRIRFQSLIDLKTIVRIVISLGFFFSVFSGTHQNFLEPPKKHNCYSLARWPLSIFRFYNLPNLKIKLCTLISGALPILMMQSIYYILYRFGFFGVHIWSALSLKSRLWTWSYSVRPGYSLSRNPEI